MIRGESFVLISVMKNVVGACYNIDLNCCVLVYKFSWRDFPKILQKFGISCLMIKLNIAFSFLQQIGDDYATKTKKI